MPKGKAYLGEIQTGNTTAFPHGSKAGPFQADDRITSTEAGRHIIPEHDAAIAKAMQPLYGGLAGKRCDPVEEWPGTHDETYGMPRAVSGNVPADRTYGEADRDDAKTFITDKSGDLKRKTAISDLSGDGMDDQSFRTHH